jgi:hypothetical protein
LNREDFNAYRSPETLGEDEKKALLTTLSDVWEVTAQRVDCYFFNEDCLFNALHGLPYATATKLHSMRPWPDCAIYNDRYLVAYQRNGNSAAGNDHVLSISREGIIKIWTIDLEPRRNPDEDEERVARLAKGVRKIFDYLRSKEKGGGLEGAADNCFLPFKSVYERLRESTG